MGDALLELLASRLPTSSTETSSLDASTNDATSRAYLQRLSTLTIKDLTTTEEETLTLASQSNLRSLQALSKRSHAAIISAAEHLSPLAELLNSTSNHATEIHDHIRKLQQDSSHFTSNYNRLAENTVLDRRKTAALLTSNNDRINNILELPSLLASVISVSAAGSTSSGSALSSSSALGGYGSALEIHAHIKRLSALYPRSELVAGVLRQADEEMLGMISILIGTLQNPNLKLAAAVRTIGWLRRVSPHLSQDRTHGIGMVRGLADTASAIDGEGTLSSLFLACRMSTLLRTLDALEPLRLLADAESGKRRETDQRGSTAINNNAGVQSERYLKRFIEIFREQSFAIVSMYKSVFPAALPLPGADTPQSHVAPADASVSGASPTTSRTSMTVLEHTPSALAHFIPQLLDILINDLRDYLPNVTDKSSRESLLSQVLFCAGSLGRLGADFSLLLALLEEEISDVSAPDEQEMEWVGMMNRHRLQASRLESLASYVGVEKRNGSVPVGSS